MDGDVEFGSIVFMQILIMVHLKVYTPHFLFSHKILVFKINVFYLFEALNRMEFDQLHNFD